METGEEVIATVSVSLVVVMGQFNLFNGDAPLHNNYPSWDGSVVLLD